MMCLPRSSARLPAGLPSRLHVQPHSRSTSHATRRGRGTRRAGMAILLVLICLIVITAVVGSMLRYLAMNNRQIKQRMHSQQAFWLADSGVERAVFRLQQDPAFREEIWQPDIAAKAGRVEIQVSTSPEMPSQWTVTVVATYPKDSIAAVKARRIVNVAVPNTTAKAAATTPPKQDLEDES